ncbi:MAG: hypothetical protein P8Z38_12935 [Robiginitalea sp.]|jgi:hypothetical protein
MKKWFLPLCLAGFLISSCKEAPKETNTSEKEQVAPENLLELLADKHGFDNWEQVDRIAFTFNVDRDTSHYERSWIWEPGRDRVTQITGGDTLSFIRSEADSTMARADAAFINDKFWFLAPYQWVWDQKSFTWEFEEGAEAPLSGDPMYKLTITYGQEGGYTPGDAYDFYLGKDSLLREWVYRKGNQPEPSLISTWEDYKDFKGLSLATMHQNSEGNFKLYFDGIRVE